MRGWDDACPLFGLDACSQNPHRGLCRSDPSGEKSELREEKTDEELTSDLRSLNSYNSYFSEVFIIAYGGNTTLNQLFTALRDNLAKFDKKIDVVVL